MYPSSNPIMTKIAYLSKIITNIMTTTMIIIGRINRTQDNGCMDGKGMVLVALDRTTTKGEHDVS